VCKASDRSGTIPDFAVVADVTPGSDPAAMSGVVSDVATDAVADDIIGAAVPGVAVVVPDADVGVDTPSSAAYRRSSARDFNSPREPELSA